MMIINEALLTDLQIFFNKELKEIMKTYFSILEAILNLHNWNINYTVL